VLGVLGRERREKKMERWEANVWRFLFGSEFANFLQQVERMGADVASELTSPNTFSLTSDLGWISSKFTWANWDVGKWKVKAEMSCDSFHV
jgi:hypothetical protein